MRDLWSTVNTIFAGETIPFMFSFSSTAESHFQPRINMSDRDEVVV